MDNFTQEMKLTVQKNSSSVIKELPSLLDVSFEQPAQAELMRSCWGAINAWLCSLSNSGILFCHLPPGVSQ